MTSPVLPCRTCYQTAWASQLRVVVDGDTSRLARASAAGLLVCASCVNMTPGRMR